MFYERFEPNSQLSSLVKEFWVFENEDSTIERQKIVPDGYSEIIIHYGDPYRINLSGSWEVQSSILFSNQISKYFFLENTGRSGMIGIKLHPASFYELFGKDTSVFTDQVISLEEHLMDHISPLHDLTSSELGVEDRIKLAEQWISRMKESDQTDIRKSVDQILESKGIIDIDMLAEQCHQSTRQFERNFKKVVGLTPKFYSRIIRFSNIFHELNSDDTSWVKVALRSGFFDQSHFIKNFKEFTGEEPSKYGFDDINLANFFLKK